MKYRKLTAILGTFVMIAAMTGCQKASTDIQLETLEISSVEEVTDSEDSSSDESEQMETLEFDFSQIDEDAGDALEASTGDIVEPEELEELTEVSTEAAEETANTRKPGEAEAESDLSEEVTDTVKNETAAKDNNKKESENTDTETESAESESETELVSVQSDKVQQMSETVPQTERVTEAAAEEESEAAEEETAEPESETATEETVETERGEATEIENESVDEESVSGVNSEEEFQDDTAGVLTGAIMTVCDRVNVRKEASTDSAIAALFTPGMKLLVVDTEGEWAAVRFESETGLESGYIKAEFLCDAEQVYYAKEKVNVRAEASTESEKVGELLANEKVVILAEENDWSKVCYATDTGLMEAYVKSEFLEKSELSSGASALMAEYESLMAEAEAETETEIETEEVSETETEVETEEVSETETEIETEEVSETETEIETEEVSEVGTEIETEEVSEVGTETETEIETEEVSETETEVDSEDVSLAEGIAGQFELTKLLFPEADTLGIIYSSEDKTAADQVAECESLASEYGFELKTTEILEVKDIDLAASSMVGSVDAILCIDDSLVNDLVQTICAYADEVEIPVIGISEAQAAMGCVAAYDGETVIWNQEEAAGFELDLASLNLENIKLYEE